MSGEMDLTVLLRGMSADLVDGVYVFATVKDGIPPGLTPRMVFHETEGTTLILLREDAEAHGVTWEFPCRMITLNVHSALEAVGFIARIATELAAAGMGVNPVAGFFHDHLFVPEDRAADAMKILAELARNA
ncbi:MAG: ACT domain-containing protein [Sedimentitalea sp.]